jgi:hypothetical protein
LPPTWVLPQRPGAGGDLANPVLPVFWTTVIPVLHGDPDRRSIITCRSPLRLLAPGLSPQAAPFEEGLCMTGGRRRLGPPGARPLSGFQVRRNPPLYHPSVAQRMIEAPWPPRPHQHPVPKRGGRSQPPGAPT